MTTSTTMEHSTSKKRKVGDEIHARPHRQKKKPRKQTEYHSSSSDEGDQDAAETSFAGVNLQDSDNDNDGSLQEIDVSKEGYLELGSERGKDERSANENTSDSNPSDAPESDAGASSDNSTASGSTRQKKVSKRNDPAAFSTSMSKILSTKLPTSARSDPLLSRSKEAAQASSELANEKLEARARAKLRADKKEELDRGRIRDVLGVERSEAGETADLEKRLKKIGQRGVVKLFNAVRAAQVRGEEAAREERNQRSTVGMGEREKNVNEISKQSFLELIHGKGGKKLNIEEA